ncbi:hypothetical protein [Pannonibacter phragmitetus]|uniref:hypothetical protein n=1 Tax=Pannonibacter phragmitetus TaxID=121719 RepID=UPI000B97A0AF|nr:hypothetical protein [Pannonibacter phragmitetus]
MGRLVWWLGVPVVFGAGVFAGVLFSPPLGTALLEAAGLDGAGRKSLLDQTTTVAVESFPKGGGRAPASDESVTIAQLMAGISENASGFFQQQHAYILSPDAIASGGNIVRTVDLTSLSLMELGKRHAQADAAGRAAILKEVERRELRATEVSGEFFPDMVLNKEHNVYIYVSRGLQGETAAVMEEWAVTNKAETAEPGGMEPVQTQTSSTIGVQLSGTGFEIDTKDFVWREVPDGKTEIFSWKVTPQLEGKLQLTVDMRQKFFFGDQTIERPVRNFPRDVVVSADFFTWVGRVAGGVSVTLDTANRIGIAIAAFLGIAGVGGVGGLIQSLYRRRKTRATKA